MKQLNPGLSVFGFALAGTQVLLANQPEGVCGNTGCNFVMLTTSLETRRLREVGTNSIYRTRDGLARRPSTIPVAGDGRTLVYYAECPSFDDCGVRGQAIRLVSGSNDVKVIDSSHPTGLAAADGRIAVAVPVSSSRTQVSIRETASGELVTTFVVSGAVKGLSLSPRRIAVLVARRTPNQRVQRVEVRDARNGKLAKSVAVPVSTAPPISIAGAEVVFRAGRTIHALDTATGRVSVAAKAAAVPIGLSIEGNRVAWAENLRVEGRSVARIRTLSLAASRGS